MHLPANQLVALPIVREMAELLVGQLGDNLGAHKRIIHLNQTLSPPHGVIRETWALEVAVIPAKAGIHSPNFPKFAVDRWIPAFAGMTGVPRAVPSETTLTPASSAVERTPLFPLRERGVDSRIERLSPEDALFPGRSFL
jgi:hypothetical protein